MNNGSSRSHSECKCENECECVSECASVNANANVSVSVDSMRQFRYLLHFRQEAWQGRSEHFRCTTTSPNASACNICSHYQPPLHRLSSPIPLPTPVASPSPFWQSPLLLSISAEHFTQLTRFCFCLFWCHQPNGSANGSGEGTRLRLAEGLETERGRGVVACLLLALAASIF